MATFITWLAFVLFQTYSEPAVIIVLSVTQILESFGCFGLGRKYGSRLALACGVFYVAIAALLCWSVVGTYSRSSHLLIHYASSCSLVSNSEVRPTLFYSGGGFSTYYVSFVLFIFGQSVWGSTLVSLRKKLPNRMLSSVAGGAFLVLAGLSLMLLPIFLFSGIVMWFRLLGWVYGPTAFAAAVVLNEASSVYEFE